MSLRIFVALPAGFGAGKPEESPFKDLGGKCISLFKSNGAKKQRKCSQRAHRTVVMAQFDLKPPPYSLNSLEPHMSRQTLEYHWGRHHRGYVENLNRQIVGTELDGMPLEDIILASYNRGDILPAFNNAAQLPICLTYLGNPTGPLDYYLAVQRNCLFHWIPIKSITRVWNHDFFWQSMKPGGGGRPSGDLLELIKRDFGSYERFLKEFKAAASTQFGSGWAWLVYKANRLDVGNAVNPCPSEKDNKLVVTRSPNAVNPLVWDYSPILAIDVWEHAYYLDYENQRADYVSTFMEKLVSWEAVSSRLELAKAQAAERAREDERRRREEEDEDMLDDEAVEMYLDSDADQSEPE